jgi:hypothetical protein
MRTDWVSVLPPNSERVRPLELFFDLVSVLAITQCTARGCARS